MTLVASGCSGTQMGAPVAARPRADQAAEPATLPRGANADVAAAESASRPLGTNANFAAHVWSVLGSDHSGNFVVSPPALALGLGVLERSFEISVTQPLREMLRDGSTASIRSAHLRAPSSELELTAELSYDPRCFALSNVRVSALRERYGVEAVAAESAGARVLAALDFSARWARPFDPEATVEYGFRLPDGQEVLVPMMWGERFARVGELPDVRLLELRLENDYAVLFSLPREPSPLVEVEQGLTPARIQQWFDALGEDDDSLVLVEIPRFAVRSNLDVTPHLARLGVDADSVRTTCGRPAEVERFVQMTEAAVDERGVRASSDLVLEIVVRGEVPHVRLDHPFLFIIHDHGKILLMGRIVDPR